MPTVWGAYVVLQIQTIGVAGAAAVAPTALTMIAPGQIRSQTMALYFMSLSMIGLLLGPTSVAFFTDNVFADEAMIRYSMAIVTLMFGIPSALALIALRRPYGRELRAFMVAADHD
jgi:MFS family permease